MARRSLALLVGVLLLTTAMITPVGAVDRTKFTARPLSQGTVYQAAKSQSGAIARSDAKLVARTDSKPVDILVKLDVDGVASYDGRLPGLDATSPSVTGKTLKENARAVRSYESHLNKVAREAATRIKARVPSAVVGETLTTAYGGISVRVPANRAKDLLGIAGVVAVQSDKLQHTTGTTSVDYIRAPQAWQQLGGSRTAGKGVIVGVLDTGIWPEHPMLADPGIPYPGGTHECQFGDGSDPLLGAPFTCNDKLVGAYVFLDTYLSQLDPEPGEFCDPDTLECSARDAEGHGTHTATTAAGSGVRHASLYGIDRGPVSGVAPGASVIAYRVCLLQGCYQSDSVAAIGQAIKDGVDVINFSISGGSSPYTDPVELAFLDAYAAGISVNASAGNAGPAAATADHAGPWVTTVGASSYGHMYLTKLVLEADGGAKYRATGSSIVPGLKTPAEVVLGSDVPGANVFCDDPFSAGSVTGKVVVCQRNGDSGRAEKSFNVLQGGAAGMILYNPGIESLFTDNFWVPTVMLEGPSPASTMLAFIASHTGVKAHWETGTPTKVTGDTMAAFSSRGPLGDFLKPDVTAPGLQILAGNTPVPVDVAAGPPGELYQAIAGTSMSGPHAAGVSALVKAAHPGWTPGQIKSALMTSSIQKVYKEDGTPADPWDRGSGAIRADRAINPTVTFDVPAEAYYASATDPEGRLDLNLASVNVNTMPGAVTTTRTVTNVSGRAQTFKVRIQDPAGTDIKVSPSAFWLPAGASKTLKISISAPSADDGWYFGEITLDAQSTKANDAVLPVAFDRTQGKIALTHTCDPTTIARRATTDCNVTATNLAPVEAAVSLKVSASSHLAISSVGAPGQPTAKGLQWTGKLSAALAPTVTSIADAAGTSPGGGYLPLSLFDIDPAPGFGDETIANYNVPDFKFGSEVYSRVAVDSNGYLVLGGGTSEDNDCCSPQTFPNPNRPNNVLAPFWTDLNVAQGGAVRAGILTDNVTDWLIFEWDAVPFYGSTAYNSFQVWIQLGATEGIWYTYGPMGGSAGNAVSAGAENRDGSSGVNLAVTDPPSFADDYVITTAPPTPGGSVSIGYQASSRWKGTYTSTASLTSDVVRGTTIRTVKIKVQ